MGFTMNKNRVAIFFIIVVYYSVTRLYGITNLMNEYFDYDEGTYLMIARLINQGYLPYRDIFAVHPPLFYYMLALWLRIFGDNYVTGRLLSVLFGLLSLFVAYSIGKELKNENLGLALAGILALDPLLIHQNRLVFHETYVEFFSIVSLYYFIRFSKVQSLKFAYLSLVMASLGTTLKFTMIPYTLALFITLSFLISEKTQQYLKSAANVIFNYKQVFIIIITYILMILIALSVIIVHPTEFIRRLMIIPGINEIKIWGHIIPSMMLLLIWGSLTIYVFKIRYVQKFFDAIFIIAENISTEVKFVMAILLPKIVVEGILGIWISKNYIAQTYALQGGRYFPIFNLFQFFATRLRWIIEHKLDFFMFSAPLMLLLVLFLLAKMLGGTFCKDRTIQYLSYLFLIETLVYFFMSPIIPDDRFLIPMTLTLCFLLIHILSNFHFSRHQYKIIISFSVIFLLIMDFGIVYRYTHGETKIIWGIHSKDMRDELKEYIIDENLLDQKFYAANPMNAYYLNLHVDPYFVDTFGLIFLKMMNATEFLAKLNDNNVRYYILSTWAYADWKAKGVEELTTLVKNISTEYKLIWGDSYEDYEILELYMSSDYTPSLKIKSIAGKLLVLDNKGEYLMFIYPEYENTYYNYRTKIYLVGDDYTVEFYSRKSTEPIKIMVNVTNETIRLYDVQNKTFIIPKNISMIVIDGNIYSATYLNRTIFSGKRVLIPTSSGKLIELEGNMTITIKLDKDVEKIKIRPNTNKLIICLSENH